MKEEIVELLMSSFSSVYCDSCKYKNYENICEDCHRKSQNWGLSKMSAEKITDDILKVVNKN